VGLPKESKVNLTPAPTDYFKDDLK